MTKPKHAFSQRIVFFGDSICFGQGVSPNRTWVTRLAAEVENLFGSTLEAPAVYNASVNGNTTRQALERMPFDVQSHGVDFLVLQLGLNDGNFWVTDGGLSRVSPDAFRANLNEIIERGLRFGAKLIQLHTNHPTTRVLEDKPFFSMTYADSNRRYNDLIRRVARDAGEEVRLIDIEAAWNQYLAPGKVSLADLVLLDGVHLSRRGHDLYFDITVEPFREAVKEIYADVLS